MQSAADTSGTAPYANSVGVAQNLSDALNWRSLHWQDGCTYEGLEAGGACESHGVVTWPSRRERYEGQLHGSRPHGYGAYRWRDGMLYRGEWYAGHMQGCGVLIWKDEHGVIQAQAGKFFDDGYVGPVPGCSAEAAHEAALEADVAAGRARTFETTHPKPPAAGTSSGPPPPGPQATGFGKHRHASTSSGWRWPWAPDRSLHGSPSSSSGAPLANANGSDARGWSWAAARSSALPRAGAGAGLVAEAPAEAGRGARAGLAAAKQLHAQDLGAAAAAAAVSREHRGTRWGVFDRQRGVGGEAGAVGAEGRGSAGVDGGRGGGTGGGVHRLTLEQQQRLESLLMSEVLDGLSRRDLYGAGTQGAAAAGPMSGLRGGRWVASSRGGDQNDSHA